MPDVYATIAEADPETQQRLAEVLELRAADAQQRAMLEAYLSELDFPLQARVLEVGCGPGPVTRVLAAWPGVAEAVGVDPSPVFIARAREKAAGVDRLRFEEGDGRALSFPDGSFHVVVFHTTLCHVPGSDKAVAEAFRVLRPGGLLAIFDGDYASTTLATGDHDPLQSCADAAMATLVHDRWLVRRLSDVVRSSGFEPMRIRSHGFVEVTEPGYMLTLVDRGADALVGMGRIGEELAAALKAEARRRFDRGHFFGHIAYGSILARKPA